MSEEKSPQRQTCETLFGSMLKQDWATFETCLDDEVFYRVGSGTPVEGKTAVMEFLKSLYTQVTMQTPDVRQVLDLPEQNQVIFEFEAHYLRLSDNKIVNFACTDILRTKGDKIKEWRVYVDMSPLYQE